MIRNVLILLILCACFDSCYSQPQRDKKVRDDRASIQDDKNWYYDDLDAGINAAQRSGKPLMVVLRCIP